MKPVPESDSRTLADSLTTEEREELFACEQVIKRGMQTFVQVGAALLTIRDKWLYRETHSTFEDYLQEHWGFDRTYAHKLITANEVSQMLPMGNRPSTERQARELAPLRSKPKVMREVWDEAVQVSGGAPTASVIKDVRKKYKEPKVKGETISTKSKNGRTTRPVGSHNHEWKKVQQFLREELLPLDTDAIARSFVGDDRARAKWTIEQCSNWFEELSKAMEESKGRITR